MLGINGESGCSVHILVIDADENSRKAAFLMLKEKGYNVDTVGSGKEAVAMTQQITYNVMLTTLDLPDMTGLKLFTRIHEAIPKIRKMN